MEQQQHATPCRSCTASVIFVPSAASGRLMILDAEPCAEGNVVINDDGKAVVLRKDLFAAGVEPNRPRYRDHHSTCPNAKEWRKK